jgi:bifunctional non-homologous end joining protein LigD
VPTAAQPVTKLPEGADWLYELKFDGYRALVIKQGEHVQIRSRNDKDLTQIYPCLALEARKLKAQQVVVDAEIVALDDEARPSFQTLQHRSGSLKHQIVFYVFDLLHVNGRNVTGEPLTTRRARLPAIVGEIATVRLSQALPGSAEGRCCRPSGRPRRCDRQAPRIPSINRRALEQLGEIEARTPTS